MSFYDLIKDELVASFILKLAFHNEKRKCDAFPI